MDSRGNLVSDLSDSGTDPHSNNPGEPGDTGGWDDSTTFNPQLFAFDATTNEATRETNESAQSRVDFRPVTQRTMTQKIFTLAREPIFSGYARPGTQIIGKIYDQYGNLIGESHSYADPGGNWMMQVHDLRAREFYRIEFQHQSAGALDVYGYFGLDPANNTYQTMEMKAWSRYDEPLSVEGAIQRTADKQIKGHHQANTRPLGFGTESEQQVDPGYDGSRGG